jgi:Mn2+/Fe2+ NRAMP family transporter
VVKGCPADEPAAARREAAEFSAEAAAGHRSRAGLAASDNDPTNVGAAAAVGAQTGYQLSWVALLVAPLLGVVLTIAAQVGAVARDDLQSLTVKRYGRGAAAVLLVSVVAVNLVTIAADQQAGAAGIGLLAGVDSRWLGAPLGAALAGLLLAGKYAQVVAVLRYLMLGFAAFGAAAVLAHPDWPRLLQASLVPALSLRPEEVAGGLALRGLAERVGRARGFYAMLVASTGLALAVTLAKISVIGMLVAASVIGGFGTPIGLVILVGLARDPRGHGTSARLPPAGHRGLGRRRHRRQLRPARHPRSSAQHALTCPARSQVVSAKPTSPKA